MLQNKEILEYMEKKEIIIEPMNENSVGSVSVDLRIGSLGKVYNETMISLDTKNRRVIKIYKKGHKLMPGETVLFHTLETISISQNITGLLTGRSTLAKVPLMLYLPGLVDPGFSGVVGGNITNLSKSSVYIPENFRICQIMFYKTENAADYSKLTRSKNNGISSRDCFELRVDKEYRK